MRQLRWVVVQQLKPSHAWEKSVKEKSMKMLYLGRKISYSKKKSKKVKSLKRTKKSLN